MFKKIVDFFTPVPKPNIPLFEFNMGYEFEGVGITWTNKFLIRHGFTVRDAVKEFVSNNLERIACRCDKTVLHFVDEPDDGFIDLLVEYIPQHIREVDGSKIEATLKRYNCYAEGDEGWVKIENEFKETFKRRLTNSYKHHHDKMNYRKSFDNV